MKYGCLHFLDAVGAILELYSNGRSFLEWHVELPGGAAHFILSAVKKMVFCACLSLQDLPVYQMIVKCAWTTCGDRV